MGRTKAGKTNADARAATRRALLLAGASLLEQQEARHPFGAFRTKQICERAGYSTGAFYQEWQDADAYYVDLATYLLAAQEPYEEEMADLKSVAESCATSNAIEAIAAVADQDLASLLANPTWDATELLNVTWARTRLRSVAREGYETVDDATALAYGVLLDRLDREVRPPLTPRQLGTLLQALVEGLGLRHRVDPDAVPSGSTDAMGLYTMGVAALLAVLTRKRGDTADTADAIASLLSRRVSTR